MSKSDTAKAPNGRIKAALRRFLALESAGGLLLIGAALLALLFASSPVAPLYNAFVTAPLPLPEVLGLSSVKEAVKNLLMVFFFALIGMELKRERVAGVLAGRGQVALPLVAALGGVLLPALIFLGLNVGGPGARGWAIPTATDIAFALAVLQIAARGPMVAAKIFLLAVAIFDDLFAILIIALFYGHGLAALPLAGAALCALGLWALNRRAVLGLLPYLALGAGLWLGLAAGGLHATLAGVLTGLALPMGQGAAHGPLERAMEGLHPWVSFAILPLFAFVAAGVDLRGLSLAALLAPLPLGILLGLILGKPLGVFGAAFAAQRLGLVPRAQRLPLADLAVVSLLAGIGFTMSLFIAQLAFDSAAMQEAATRGVLLGSLLCALLGVLALRLFAPAALVRE